MILEINGEQHNIEAAPDTALLYVLRNDLGLVGSRFGCGSGLCGACYVLLDGRPIASCDLPISFVVDKKVTTIEGLGGNAVQKALVDEQAAQCGYCMTGIVISATALLEKNNKPTEDEIRSALDKNLCRCGTHNRLVRAVLRAANEQAR
jgi:nicotinate dehydrogenase subunit A